MCHALLFVCLKIHLYSEWLWEWQLVTHSPMTHLCLCSISDWFQSLFAGGNTLFHGQSDAYKAARSVRDLQLTSNCKKKCLQMKS